jgi:hypothetical protein
MGTNMSYLSTWVLCMCTDVLVMHQDWLELHSYNMDLVCMHFLRTAQLSGWQLLCTACLLPRNSLKCARRLVLVFLLSWLM